MRNCPNRFKCKFVQKNCLSLLNSAENLPKRGWIFAQSLHKFAQLWSCSQNNFLLLLLHTIFKNKKVFLKNGSLLTTVFINLCKKIRFSLNNKPFPQIQVHGSMHKLRSLLWFYWYLSRDQVYILEWSSCSISYTVCPNSKNSLKFAQLNFAS